MRFHMPVKYLNLYLIAIFGGLVSAIIGILICYAGVTNTSYIVNQGTEMTTYYLDKNRHDLYLKGLIYCFTFGIAFLLLISTIVIPSPNQIQKRNSKFQPAIGKENDFTVPDGVSNSKSEVNGNEFENNTKEDKEHEIELEPDIESFEIEQEDEEKEDESAFSSSIEDDDSDVVYGKGRITDMAHRSFILSSPDSAVKFLTVYYTHLTLPTKRIV